VIGDVDLAADETESRLAVRLRAPKARIGASSAVAGAVLSLSAPTGRHSSSKFARHSKLTTP